METSAQPSGKPMHGHGLAGLFDHSERKTLFRKYVIFLGWVELLILVVCWLYQLGDRGYDRFGPVEVPFPWKIYFLISFLAPIAITFLIGVVIVGFNKYFGDAHPAGETAHAADDPNLSGEKAGRVYQLQKLMTWLQRLPFLALLLLLGIGAIFFYKLDAFLGFVGNVGEKSVRIVLISAAVLVLIASIFALILIVLNYQLRKRSMDYQYKSEVAERFGLIILEDNTVLNSQGKLLIQGKKGKEMLPLLSAETGKAEEPEPAAGPISQTVELKTS
jgi:hypothetical protein